MSGRAYYNEFDPKAAAWLRELIKAGLIADGDVDERSIADVRADDLRGYCQCHFFAGIGGWSYALRLAGWPDDRAAWTGSCPCQPFSCAGKQLGQADERHLWPEFFRLIRECRPERVYGEQVAQAIGLGWLDGVSADLEGEGYAVGAAVLGAHSVGAPHIRQRLYWMADAQLQRAGSRIECVEGREGQWRDRPSINGEIGGLADATSRGQRINGGAQRNTGHADECGAVVGLAEAQRDGGRQHEQERHPQGRAADGRFGAWAECGRLGNSIEPRLEGHARNGDGSQGGANEARSTATTGAWSDYRIAYCRDGKARRIPVEPALFPLADGVPGRVGLLRGAGNAIVPQVAAAFIEASEEAIREVA